MCSFPKTVVSLFLAGAGLVAGAPAARAETLSGAGSSAAAPVYRIWAAEYAKDHGDALNYRPVGSGAGMASIVKREVDFGASDFIASPAELRKNDLIMFPTVITGVVPVVNLPHVEPHAMRLTGEVLARIFLGQITQWSDPALRALNPDLRLPAQRIQLVVRADGSGTTYHFSDYLSRVSPAWKQRFGVASRFDWPATALAVQGSGEVSRTVRATAGSIGYIDYNYVVDDGLTDVLMRNAQGRDVQAAVEGFREAVRHSTWYSRGDFSTEINDAAGDSTWPITMGTYIAVPRVSRQPARTERALRFVTWAYLHGDALARQARFVPLPDKVQASAYAEISKVVSASGEPIGVKTIGELVR